MAVAMNINELLSDDRVVCDAVVTSKKRVLEMMSQLLASAKPNLSYSEIFNSLVARERLGSTGLGYGVAIPHGRISGLPEAVGAFVKLKEGVDFDAVDKAPVDLLFALLVPAEATEEHLNILAALAELFKEGNCRERLRAAAKVSDIRDCFGARPASSQKRAATSSAR